MRTIHVGTNGPGMDGVASAAFGRSKKKTSIIIRCIILFTNPRVSFSVLVVNLGIALNQFIDLSKYLGIALSIVFAQVFSIALNV